MKEDNMFNTINKESNGHRKYEKVLNRRKGDTGRWKKRGTRLLFRLGKIFNKEYSAYQFWDLYILHKTSAEQQRERKQHLN